MAMICPDCGSTLTSGKLAGVPIDECLECGGRWFDRGELREAEEKTDEDLSWKDFSLWKDLEDLSVGSRRTECPSCEGSLVPMVHGETRVTVNYCPDCRGAWLAKGAFERIMESLERELDAMSASDYLKETVREAGELLDGGDDIGEEWKQFRTVLRLLEYRFMAEHSTLARLIENFTSPFA